MKSRSDIGLFGYNQGSRSFFINSKNGSALFGNGNGQIIIDPGTVDSSGNVQNAKAMLYSHNFWKASNYNSETGLPNSYSESYYADAGMLIDLTTPQIVFKDKNFWIQSDGSIKSNRIPQYENNQIKRDSNGQIIYQNKWGFEINSQTGAINSGYNINIDDYNFKIDANGNVSFVGDLKAGRINSSRYNFFFFFFAQPGQNPKHNLLQAGWDTDNNKYNFTITADGDVSIAGDITANSGHIGGPNGWTIGSNSIYKNRNTWYGQSIPHPDGSTSVDWEARGLYIGTDGISAGNGTNITFYIDSGGNVYLNGNIYLSKDSSINFGNNVNHTIGELVSDVQNIVNGVGGSSLHYITGTFINGTTIESPTIYAGHYYSTGDGADN